MKNSLLLAALALLCGMTSSASAGTVLQIDFGSTAYVGNNAPAGVSDTVWNTNNNQDIFSGLLFGDGSAATGVSVELGAGSSGGVINFLTDDARNPSSNGDIQGGVYDTNLTDDWVFDSNDADLGARISGLAPGDYDVYAYTKEPNQLTRTYDVGIGTFAAANADNVTSASTQLITTAVGDATGSTTFINGQNFAFTRVTVTNSTDFITVVVDPSNARFATLGAIQIVAIPEPTSLALLSLSGLGLVLRRRR